MAAISRQRHAAADSAPEQWRELQKTLTQFLGGKEDVVQVTLCALLSSSHLLLEDVPGIGKTTFAKLLAQLLDLDMKRVQFTADLLPADIIGVEVYDATTGQFWFNKGPLFTHILLADEINRTSPRTQSALLEVMGEGSITVDKTTHELAKPFFVIATQNPAESLGTYPLPESQLDRFAARISLSYPDADKETAILGSLGKQTTLQALPKALVTRDNLLQWQNECASVSVAPMLARYVQEILHRTRHHPSIKLGVSTRGGINWVRMAQGAAWMQGRSYLIPDDLIDLAVPCLQHRIHLQVGQDGAQVVRAILQESKVPT